mgnify:CR=1 FL=1
MTTDTSRQTGRLAAFVSTVRDAINLYPETWIALAIAPLYGMVAFPPIIDTALLAHGRRLPILVGALLGLLVPIGFRVWKRRVRAKQAIAFTAIATPLTFILYTVLFDQFPVVRGRLLPVVDVALVAGGGVGIALTLTWHQSGDDEESAA